LTACVSLVFWRLVLRRALCLNFYFDLIFKVFDLGFDGRSIQKFGALYREQIEHLAKESCNVNPELFSEIDNISPIPLSQSINVNLVMVS